MQTYYPAISDSNEQTLIKSKGTSEIPRRYIKLSFLSL